MIKYGVVYTPDSLAEFVAELLTEIIEKDNSMSVETILDPACGEGALLQAYKKANKKKARYIGIDIDSDAVEHISKEFDVYLNDFLMPKTKKTTCEFWKTKLPKVQAVIANPPWSSEKLYSRENLKHAGFSLINGQYDSYVLFIELAYNLIQDNGYFAFIIPDSIFDAQNELLREFLVENTWIRSISRLGEKLFENINRATTVIICQKKKPSDASTTVCFRLSTTNRKYYLSRKETLHHFYAQSAHEVYQKRFRSNDGYKFDIDTHVCEEELLGRIRENCIDWENDFKFGRGVELSKTGEITICELCGDAQGFTEAQYKAHKKICTSCQKSTIINDTTTQVIVANKKYRGFSKIIVGEDLHRYMCKSKHYIKDNVKGINYKDASLYEAPKLLVRKTGLGIYAAIDYSNNKTSQTVYILKSIGEKEVPLEYYLALLNSRVVYYYYLKVYGENEWKSHPYFTKKIIFSLPIKKYEGTPLDCEIVKIAKQICRKYNYRLDLELEKLVMQKYGFSEEDKKVLRGEMDSLPNLSSMKNMKMGADG